ncbi:MAG TPA: glyoxylate/hydroxypyruvate reductase A [Burkholderiaceae bacterium]
MLLVNSGGEAAVDEWSAHFQTFAPHLSVHWWDDPAVDPDRVDYALVWQPAPGRLAALPNLRLVLSAGAGVDHITADPAWPRAVPLIRSIPPETAQRMGEYVALAALALLRDFKRIARQQAAREWVFFDVARSAPEVCVGILGLGTLGLQAAQMLQALGFRTIGWSRTAKTVDGMLNYAGPEALDAFLAHCDLLVCLLPATPQTERLLNAERLARLPHGAALIHVGRGAQLDTGALIAALDSGRLSGAFIDVFDEEPLPADHPAWSHPGITISPHIAATATRRMRAQFFARQIAAFEQGEPVEGRFDPERGY